MHQANEARGTAHDATWVQMVVRLCRERGIDTAKPKPAVAAPLRRRFLVLQRDGFRCRYCGAAPNFAHLHVDHAISMRDGGSDEMDNLVTSCRECNLGKGSFGSRAGGVMASDLSLHTLPLFAPCAPRPHPAPGGREARRPGRGEGGMRRSSTGATRTPAASRPRSISGTRSPRSSPSRPTPPGGGGTRSRRRGTSRPPTRGWAGSRS